MKFASLVFVIAMLASSVGYADQVVLITNKANPVTSVSARDAKNIFLGKKSKWSDGTKVVSYTQNDNGLTEAFTQKFVSQSAKQFSLHWRKAVFTGAGTPPEKVSDSASMKQMVASNAGSLGYILESELDDSVVRLQIH